MCGFFKTGEKNFFFKDQMFTSPHLPYSKTGYIQD